MNPSNSVIPSPKSSKGASSSQRQEPPLRACVTCRKLALHAWSTYKNCERCRALNRKKHKEAQDRKFQRLALHAKQFSNVNLTRDSLSPEPTLAAHIPESQMAGVKENANAGKVHTHAKPTNLTAKALHELEGDAQTAAMKQMKKRLNVVAKASKRVDNKSVEHIHGTSHYSPGGKEYQTATALYDSLKRRSTNNIAASKKLKFNGYHAIVFVSTIDHLKRVEMVANDLRKIARLPFDHTKPNHSYDFKTMARTVTFQCTCLGHRSASSDALRMGATPSPRISTPQICGGTVTITAVDDATHPLNILGQRIIVRVEHK